MKRREFIEKTGKAIALVAVGGQAGLTLDGCQSGTYRRTNSVKPDFEVPVDSALPKVTLAKNSDHAQALRTALDAIGGIERFIKSGESVLLKPNVAWDRTPEQAVNTNPVLVGEMVHQCLEAGASEVLVAEYGTQDPRRTFARSGIRDAVGENGGRLLILTDNDFVETDFKGRFIKNWPVMKYVFEIDRLVNMPIAKHHGLVYGTASMKNFFGAIGGVRDRLHDQLDQAIVDLASYFRPTLTVIDATRVLMRDGPSGGSIEDVKICDSVICATDQVAGDSRASEFLGTTGDKIGHVALAAAQGLGEIDYRKAGYKEIL
jgi:uncharacterized protein (DUF362 family)